jgi:tRNA-splicing ligase RtcB (3'-phosphate/5'-hydroxy nucleic acid ligase)
MRVLGVISNYRHLGTLGGGNHFIEICLDEANAVWIMLHSGSRGVGNAIGTLFIEKAKDDMRKHFINLPDQDLSYLVEGTEHYTDYVEAVGWAQKFAQMNRETMMHSVIRALRSVITKPFETHVEAVNCHHNYVQEEVHFGERVHVTRKGAVRAGKGELGIIPGSMGAKSYIVRGKGNPESFESCSHGAGRTMSRTEAKRRFTVQDQIAMTEGVECRKDENVVDEIPAAYKDIDAVMAAQSDLVEVVHTLKQVVCVKG